MESQQSLEECQIVRRTRCVWASLRRSHECRDRSRTLSENERIQDECSYRICSTQSFITPLGLSCGCSRCSESTSFSGTCSCTRWVLHGPRDNMAPGMGR